jgi:hypothetical protein
MSAGNRNWENVLSDEDLEAFEAAGQPVAGPAVGSYDIPTSTSNVKRPRTLAAGYDPNSQVVTVVFRDGTFYNYYGISAGTWLTFKESYSKQKMLNSGNQRNWQGKDDGPLLVEADYHGPANLNDMTEEAQAFFVTVARSAQIAYRENRPRFNKGITTTGSQIKSYENRQYRSALKARATASQNSKLGKNNSNGGKNRATANKPK